MRTLYVRIVLISIFISLISSLLAFFATSIHYQVNLKNYYEEKLVGVVTEIKTLYDQTSELTKDEYFPHVANMGFQIYVTDGEQGNFYGRAFKNSELPQENIQNVLNGTLYYGVLRDTGFISIAGYFENSLQNTVGLPIQIQGKTYALFVKPDLTQQIGEVRSIMALIIVFTFLFSIVLTVIFTRFIVRPIQSLTAATQKIAGGEYNLKLDVNRRDEFGELAGHFTQMAQSLKQLDEMRQEFVANVSHEIQSPLTSIQGFVQEVKNESTAPADKERYLTIIDEESRRLSSLSKQLLTLATLDKESHAIKPTVYRLDEQIRQVIISTEWLWMEKNLIIDPELTEVNFCGDQQLLHLVWINLLTNAIKFSNSGSVITVQIKVEHDIVIKFSDQGDGIPGPELAHIFDRFYKVDKARNRTHSGSGLGLAIVYKIIQLHEGTIHVQSELGVGTTFTIRLPHL